MSPFNNSAVPTVFFSSPPFLPTKEVTWMILVITSLVFVFVTKSKPYFSNPTKRKKSNYELPPGPKPWPILGNLPEMLIHKALTGQPAFQWIHGLMNQLQTDIACVRLGNVHLIPVRSPEIAREFYKKHDLLFASRPFTAATECSSGGYLTTAVVPEGKQWKKMRKLLGSHIINPSKLRFLRPLRDQEADHLVRFLYAKCEGSESLPVVDVRFVARTFCGNVFRQMMFGQRYFGRGRENGGPGFEDIEHVESSFKVLSLLYAFSPSDHVPYLRLLDLDGNGRSAREAMGNINKYHHPIVDERVKLWREGKRSEPKDMLDLFILAKDSSGQELSTEEIKAQCAELVLATVDNPSNAVEWTLAEMINQPEILHKAVEEIDQVVGKERLVQESDLSSLRYVKACVREAFRLHPIAPFNLPHVSTTDVVVSGYFIPKGSWVLLSRMELGRNPKVWKDPSKFQPERHLEDNSVEVEITEPNLRFISFSTGARGCVGVTLGSTMLLMLLTRLLQAFSWKTPLNEDEIDLTQSKDDLFLSQPLHALMKPRLDAKVYRV